MAQQKAGAIIKFGHMLPLTSLVDNNPHWFFVARSGRAVSFCLVSPRGPAHLTIKRPYSHYHECTEFYWMG
jgi:hypothetical protein